MTFIAKRSLVDQDSGLSVKGYLSKQSCILFLKLCFESFLILGGLQFHI